MASARQGAPLLADSRPRCVPGTVRLGFGHGPYRERTGGSLPAEEVKGVKTTRLAGKLVYEREFAEYFGTSLLQPRSAAFDLGSATVTLHRGILRRTTTTIPFDMIRRVRHGLVAPLSFSMDSSSLVAHRSVTERTEILLDLQPGAAELVYRFGWGVEEGAGRTFPAPHDVARTQGLADEIARTVGKPIRIDIEEAEFSIDMGSRTIELTGMLLPFAIRGTVIPFDRVRTILAIRSPGGYVASGVVTKSGERVPTMRKIETESWLHETLAVCAGAAGLPFEVSEDRNAVPFPPS